MDSQPSILIATVQAWVGIARMPGALKQAGFRVAAFARNGAPLTASSALARCETFAPETTVVPWLTKLLALIDEMKPTLLIGGDEAAVQSLQAGRSLAEKSHPQETIECLTISAGPTEHFATLLRKTQFMKLADSLGLPVPERKLVASVGEAVRFARKYPNFVLKSDRGFGGIGVRVCSASKSDRSHANVERAFVELTSIQDDLGAMLVEAQRFIPGLTGETAFVAWKGTVLDAFAIVRESRHPAGTGPSTRIHLIHNDTVLDQVKRIVEATSYTGFGGIEFVLEGTTGSVSDLTGNESPVLIEFNPRPLPYSHLGPVFGHDLAGALYAQIQGTPFTPSGVPITQSVTLFPQEMRRDPTSPYLANSYHDVPSDDPKLLQRLLES